MKNINILLLIALLFLSAIVFIGPFVYTSDAKTPDSQLADFVNSERYIDADELADKLVNKDPSIQLIDLRGVAEFESYHIPTAKNIPFDLLLNDENKELINQDKVSLVFYSNDHYLADQAWYLTQSLGYNNIIVLKDGLNGFYETILNPTLPSDEMSREERQQYSYRKAAGIFFGIPYDAAPVKTEVKTEVVKAAPVKVVPVKKEKIEIEEGGC